MSADFHTEDSRSAQAFPQGVSRVANPINRVLPLHLAAAALAVFAAGVLQIQWPDILARLSQVSWWPADAGVLVAATAYLLSVAAVHARSAYWPADKSIQQRLLLGRELISSLIVALYFAIVFWQGPSSALLRAGLWRVPPLLLLVAVVSLLVLGVALWNARSLSRSPAEGKSDAADAGAAPSRWNVLPTILLVGLFMSLVALNRHQPSVRPRAAPVNLQP
jgi:hypothetical protein